MGCTLVAQMVKNLPAMWETRVLSLDQEDLLEKEMASLSIILTWGIPWTEEPGGLQSMVGGVKHKLMTKQQEQTTNQNCTGQNDYSQKIYK